MTREVVSSKISGKINGALLFVCHLRFSFKSCLIKIPLDIFHFALHFSVSSCCSHLQLYNPGQAADRGDDPPQPVPRAPRGDAGELLQFRHYNANKLRLPSAGRLPARALLLAELGHGGLTAQHADRAGPGVRAS